MSGSISGSDGKVFFIDSRNKYIYFSFDDPVYYGNMFLLMVWFALLVHNYCKKIKLFSNYETRTLNFKYSISS